MKETERSKDISVNTRDCMGTGEVWIVQGGWEGFREEILNRYKKVKFFIENDVYGSILIAFFHIPHRHFEKPCCGDQQVVWCYSTELPHD